MNPDVVDPSPGLGDGDEESLVGLSLHRQFGARRMNDAAG
jgi:hypothetical protein